jgi:signal transduction histidine kinase
LKPTRQFPEKSADKLQRFETLLRVSTVINSSLEPEKVLNHVTAEAVRITNATSGSLVLIDPHTQLLEIQVAIGLREPVRQVRLAIGKGVTGWVAKHGRPLRVPDVSQDPRYVSVEPSIRSELAVPLMVEGELIGVLNVDSTRPDAFDSDDEDLLVALAHQAAQVIHNSWLYEAVAHNARKLESLFSVAESIIASLDVEEILPRVVTEACRLMQTKVCSLMLLDKDGQKLHLRACHGAGPMYTNRPALEVKESLIGVVVRHRRHVQVYNVQHDNAFHYIEMARQEGLVSLLSVPMMFGGTAIGALNAYTDTPYHFSNQDVKTLSTLANLAAVAIENARLHNKIMEVEEQLRHNERLSALGLLAAEVAHEIRNPLAVMKMLFHSLDLKFPADDPRSRDAEIIAEKMDGLNRIVGQLLGHAKSSEPDFGPVALNDLLEDVLLLVRPKLAQQNIVLEKELTGDLPLVRADRGQLEQVFLNLTLNATQAMPNGGRLIIRTGRQGGDRVGVRFEDTGVGMTEEQQRQLFEPFFSARPGGVGLGLAIVQKILEAHHGAMEVKSVSGRGTAFHITLPAMG